MGWSRSWCNAKQTLAPGPAHGHRGLVELLEFFVEEFVVVVAAAEEEDDSADGAEESEERHEFLHGTQYRQERRGGANAAGGGRVPCWCDGKAFGNLAADWKPPM